MAEETSIHQTFSDLISDWAQAPDYATPAVEGAEPQFSRRFGQEPLEFTFDQFFHDTDVEGWNWKTIELTELFAGAFFLYLPESWHDVRQHKNCANVIEGNAIKQSIFVLDKPNWSKTVPDFLDEFSIEAFAYFPLFPKFDQWVICTRDKEKNVDWLYGLYGAGDWVFAIKADAGNDSDLRTQLISLVNSNPWYGWLQQAKKQGQSETED